MGKIVATYLVKLTIRVPDDTEEDESLDAYAPTNDALATLFEDALTEEIHENGGRLEVNATSERTDK